MSLKGKLFLSMIGVVVLAGFIPALIGGTLLYFNFRREAESRIAQHLHAARGFYSIRVKEVEAALTFTALGEGFSKAVEDADAGFLLQRLEALSEKAGLDFVSVLDPRGLAKFRTGHGGAERLDLSSDFMVKQVLGGADSFSGTVVFDAKRLEAENPDLAARARIQMKATQRSAGGEGLLDSGLVMCSAAAVRRKGALVGVLLGGKLLNGDVELVDRFQKTVFGIAPGDRPTGTATVFLGDVRVSTNVQFSDGSRALGTRVSEEVRRHVLEQGRVWVGSAWVVDAWYISSYEPLLDAEGRIVGMLYVGELEERFRGVSVRSFAIFLAGSLAGLAAVAVFAWRLSTGITTPLDRLVEASRTVATGNFCLVLKKNSRDEIAALVNAFNTMVASLMQRDELIAENTRKQLDRSERLASTGRLAAGVAHEINNPLTGILTFAHLLRDRFPEGDEGREDAETIIEATERCKVIVRGLLGFARRNEPSLGPADLKSVLHSAVTLVSNQARMNGISIEEDYEASLPELILDRIQIEEVAVNLLLNSIDATPRGGKIKVATRSDPDWPGEAVEIEFSDTGSGIPAENLEKIFDPFFTTKPAGQGTGLGLAVAFGIVSRHGGTIKASSRPGEGTTMKVSLPVGGAEAGHA